MLAPLLLYDVQPSVTYSNIQTCNADADEGRHGDGDATVYANILPSGAAKSQCSNSEEPQSVVYSELQPNIIIVSPYQIHRGVL